MKLAYKLVLPLVVLVTILILLVTTRAFNSQEMMIEKAQKERYKIIHDQFEKNRDSILETQKKEIAYIAELASEISVNYLYDFDFEALNKPLLKLLHHDGIEAIIVIENSKNEAIVTLGKVQKNYEKIVRDVIWKESSLRIGQVEVYYDNTAIHEFFEASEKELISQIQKSKVAQDKDLEEILKQQIIFDLFITLVVLILLLVMVYKEVISPLAKLEAGLDAFFMFLQGKSSHTKQIEIHTKDEFGKMSQSVNENIQVSAKLHEEIYELNSNLEAKVEERTHQVIEKSEKIRQLLDNAAEGFLSFDETLMVDDEYSKECEKIFNMSIEGKSVVDLLHGNINEEDKELFIKMVKDIFSPKVPQRRKAVLLRLFPNEFQINNKNIKVNYKIITDKKMMLILTDITENKVLEERIELEKKRLKMVVSVVSNLAEFHEIIEEFATFCETQEKVVVGSNDFLNKLILFYRGIHTFKGNFAQKELVYIVPKLHEFESKLNSIIKNPERKIEDFTTLLYQNDLRSWLDEDMQVLNDILDERFLENRHKIAVAEPIIDMVENKLKQLVQHPKNERDVTYEEILDDVSNMKKRSLLELLNSYTLLVKQLATRLDKHIYPMQILGDEVYITNNIKPFVKSLVHIFRNSVDHGIESLEERVESNKSEIATINCTLRTNEKSLIIEVIDDGRGIDSTSIKEKLLQKGKFPAELINAMSEQDLLEQIFSDNFSTKDEISDLSGRGVGLSVIKEEVTKLEGKVEVMTKLSQGTTFIFTLPIKNIT